MASRRARGPTHPISLTCWPSPRSRSITARPKTRRSPRSCTMRLRIRVARRRWRRFAASLAIRSPRSSRHARTLNELPKPPWRERKEAFVERLRTEPYSVRLVVAADKLHNVRDVLRNFRIHGDDLWLQFKGGRDGTIWYYRAVVGALSEAATPEEQQLNALIEEISDTLSLLEEALADRSMQIRPAELA